MIRLTYCKAYERRQLRVFQGWPADEGADDDVLFLHEDLSVTADMAQGERVVFDGIHPDWAGFCRDVLAFEPRVAGLHT